MDEFLFRILYYRVYVKHRRKANELVKDPFDRIVDVCYLTALHYESKESMSKPLISKKINRCDQWYKALDDLVHMNNRGFSIVIHWLLESLCLMR